MMQTYQPEQPIYWLNNGYGFEDEGRIPATFVQYSHGGKRVKIRITMKNGMTFLTYVKETSIVHRES